MEPVPIGEVAVVVAEELFGQGHAGFSAFDQFVVDRLGFLDGVLVNNRERDVPTGFPFFGLVSSLVFTHGSSRGKSLYWRNSSPKLSFLHRKKSSDEL